MYTTMQGFQNVGGSNNVLQEKPLNIKAFSEKVKELRELMLENDPHRFDKKEEDYAGKRAK